MSAPNPVQRRGGRALASDDLIAPCAQEGGTFRDPVTRSDDPGPEYTGSGFWMAVAAIVVVTVLFCIFGEANNVRI